MRNEDAYHYSFTEEQLEAEREQLRRQAEEAEKEARFNALCDAYRAMRREIEGKPHSEQLKAINDFRAGRIIDPYHINQ